MCPHYFRMVNFSHQIQLVSQTFFFQIIIHYIFFFKYFSSKLSFISLSSHKKDLGEISFSKIFHLCIVKFEFNQKAVLLKGDEPVSQYFIIRSENDFVNLIFDKFNSMTNLISNLNSLLKKHNSVVNVHVSQYRLV